MTNTGIDTTNVEESYQKYIDGDSLTVSELIDLHVHMRLLHHLVAPLGDRFHFLCVETVHVMAQTKAYLDSRREDGIENKNGYVPKLPDEQHDYRRLKLL